MDTLKVKMRSQGGYSDILFSVRNVSPVIKAEFFSNSASKSV